MVSMPNAPNDNSSISPSELQ
jgi:hypothetical protein